MCSVVGCGSWRRSALRFKLPEDPELRLEWVQFVFEANGQRLQESSWTDISVCNEHFTEDCFEPPGPGTGVPGWVQLKPGAVPSLCVKSEPEDGAGCREPVETTDATFQCDDIKSPTSLTDSQARPVSGAGSDQMHQKVPNADSNKNKTSLLQMEECPSCGCKLETEKVTYGVLVVLNQRCLQCDYRYQWKSQVDASVPTAEEQHPTEEVKVEVTPETKQETDDDPSGSVFSRIVTFSDEDGDPSDGEEGGDGVGVSSDGEWNPTERFLLAEELKQESEEEEEGSDQMHQKAPNVDSNKKKAAPLQKKRKHVVNESCLFQLFRRKCPSCGCKLQMEKVTYGVLVVLNQRCLQCDYEYQWKSQVDASVPTAEEVTPETRQETDDNPSGRVFSEILTFSDEDSDPSEAEEEGNVVGVNSDQEWIPRKKFLPAVELREESEEEDEGEEEEEEGVGSRGGLKVTELCTECGSFFPVRKHHTCEHKVKPYSCNICGKRCVTEKSLKSHSRIHDATYDYPCKYCYVIFKTKLDKLKHEQFHRDNEDHFKCPDCPEAFSTFMERRIHLTQNHRTVKEYKCGVCGFEFKDVHHLRRHSAVHTGLKPFQCSVCQRGFNQSNHLKSHMRLHTGEKPFQCRHCDQSFNHNVSLKSHVQRYHPASSSSEGKTDERASAAGSDSEVDCVEQPGEEEVQEEAADVGTNAESSTARPKGRPKRKASGGSAARRREGKRPNAKKVQKTGSSEEESEDKQSDADVPFDSGEEEGARERSARSRGRRKDDSDTDFDPEEGRKKKRSSGKNPEKRRGRPSKNVRKQSKHTAPKS